MLCRLTTSTGPSPLGPFRDPVSVASDETACRRDHRSTSGASVQRKLGRVNRRGAAVPGNYLTLEIRGVYNSGTFRRVRER